MPRFNTTTDLNILRSQPRRHTWGPVTKIHDIGRYTVVEYTCESTGPSNGQTHFGIYIDGKGMNESALTLESALITAMAYAAHSDRTYGRSMALAAERLLTNVG
jgi:hypothetical protein